MGAGDGNCCGGHYKEDKPTPGELRVMDYLLELTGLGESRNYINAETVTNSHKEVISSTLYYEILAEGLIANTTMDAKIEDSDINIQSADVWMIIEYPDRVTARLRQIKDEIKAYEEKGFSIERRTLKGYDDNLQKKTTEIINLVMKEPGTKEDFITLLDYKIRIVDVLTTPLPHESFLQKIRSLAG